MKKMIPFIAFASLFFLTGCVSQDQADKKMAKGCRAGIEALIAPKTILEVRSQNYSQEETEGGLHRRITFNIVEKDGWFELDKTYSCLFMQDWGLFKMSHTALLVQIKGEDILIGKNNGIIEGSVDDFIRLSNHVERAMEQ